MSSEKRMKKFISSIFIILLACVGAFFANVSNATFTKNSANADTLTDSESVSNAFSDNENLSALVGENIVLDSKFNVLETQKVNLELYDQNPYGTCYATSLAQVLNLCYEYQYGEHIKVSAVALALQIEDLFFDYGSDDVRTIESTFDLSYVSEFDFPYELAYTYDKEMLLDASLINFNFESKEIIDVKEYYSFPNYLYVQNSSEELQQTYLNTIKKALVKQGALAVGLRYKVEQFGDYYVYNSENSETGGHAMTLVGYDDNFSKSNFVTEASADGAFIILNSWGTARQEIVYVSYDDIYALEYIFGVGGFVEPDERAEEISNIDKSLYYMIDSFKSMTSASGLEFGYQISNISNNEYLSQIELQPTSTSTDHNFYHNSLDVEIYINSASNDIDMATTLLGTYDINSGSNKIVLETPVAVGEEFALRFVVKDDTFTYGYFDKASQNFSALFDVNGSWQTVSYSNDNYNLVRTPFFLKTVVTNEEKFAISKTDNHQKATTNLVTFELSSTNSTISDVGVQIFKHDVASISFTTYEMTDTDAIELFDVSINSTSVSIAPKSFMAGTFKVIITLNGGEKQFIKFLCFDDGMGLTTFNIDPEGTSFGYYQKLYDNSLMAGTINVTIPSHCKLYYTIDSGTKLHIKNSFVFDTENVTVTPTYAVDTEGRIASATIVFTHNTLGTTRTLNIKFTYTNINQIIYTTAIPNATHSNPENLETGVTISLTNTTAPNYEFFGWYLDAGFTEKVTSLKFNADGSIAELYAKFVQKEMPTIAKKVTYDETSSIMTVSLDFSNYNLAIYDTIEFSNITHYFQTTSSPNDFTILKSALNNKVYLYQIYVEKESLKTVNSIEFDITVKRYKLYNMSLSYSLSMPLWLTGTTLDMSVSVNDVVPVTISATGSGNVFNSVTGEKLSNGIYYISYGGDLYLNFAPSDKYYISSVIVNGTSVGIPSSYSFVGLTKNSSIAIVFTLRTFEISMVVNGNGSVDKALLETVSVGDSITYTFTPDNGAFLDYVMIDGVKYTDITSYTFANVQENHTITVYFATYQYTVTASITGRGDIGQPTISYVNYGDDLTFIFVASTGYTLKKIVVDGQEISVVSSYTFENITSNHSIQIVFEKDVVNVYVEIAGVGRVSVTNSTSNQTLAYTEESTSFTVEYGSNMNFIVTPNDAYEVSAIYINDTSIGSKTSFVYQDTIEDVEIRIVFAIKTYTLKLQIYGSGYSDQSTIVTKSYGESIQYNFTASQGYKVSSIVINGSEVLATATYLIENIKTNYNIVVTFEKITFNISWFGYNNVLITTTKVEYNQLPVMSFVTPTRPSEGIYVYVFAGWNTELDGEGTSLVPATQDATYYAQYNKELVKFEIKATTNGYGEISPSGSQMVEYGSSKTFTFIAYDGYHLSRIVIDENTVIENISDYTFEDVKNSHKILAIFRRNDFEVVISNDIDKGEIVGKRKLERNEYSKYTIIPKEGYKVSRVLIDGNEVKLDKNNSFVVENVNEDFSIVVEYSSKNSSKAIKYLKENFILAAIVVGGIAIVSGIVIAVKVHNRRKRDEFDEDVA